MNIGQRIKQRRVELGLSVDDIAEKIGKNRATVYRYESSEIEDLPTSILEPLAKALSTTPAYLMGWETDNIFSIPNIIPLPETKDIPLIGDIACGEPILAEENIEDYVKLNKDIDAEFALRCKGDSMTGARIRNGDIVYIHQQEDVENGEIAAVLIGNEATLKKVYKYPEKNMLVLKPANPEYEDFIFTGEELEEIRILGKAVAFLSSI